MATLFPNQLSALCWAITLTRAKWLQPLPVGPVDVADLSYRPYRIIVWVVSWKQSSTKATKWISTELLLEDIADFRIPAPWQGFDSEQKKQQSEIVVAQDFGWQGTWAPSVDVTWLLSDTALFLRIQWPFTVCGSMQAEEFRPLDKAMIPTISQHFAWVAMSKASYTAIIHPLLRATHWNNLHVLERIVRQFAGTFWVEAYAQTLRSSTRSPHSLQLFLLLGKSLWTQPLWVPMRHWHKWYMNVWYIMIQATHVAGIPHTMRLGLGVSRSLELLQVRKCNAVQSMLLVQWCSLLRRRESAW